MAHGLWNKDRLKGAKVSFIITILDKQMCYHLPFMSTIMTAIFQPFVNWLFSIYCGVDCDSFVR